VQKYSFFKTGQYQCEIISVYFIHDVFIKTNFQLKATFSTIGLSIFS